MLEELYNNTTSTSKIGVKLRRHHLSKVATPIAAWTVVEHLEVLIGI
jgi:hypothetical protein